MNNLQEKPPATYDTSLASVEQLSYLVSLAHKYLGHYHKHAVERENAIASFKYLLDSAQRHFAAESEALRQLQDPDARDHIGHHNGFLSALGEMHQGLVEEKDKSVVFEELNATLQQWFDIHSNKYDAKSVENRKTDLRRKVVDSPAKSENFGRLLRKGLELYGQQRLEEAYQCWRDVLAADPTNQTALDYLESAGEDTAQYIGADEFVNKGVEYFSFLQFEAAKAMWEKALTLDPANERATGFLDELQRKGLHAGDDRVGSTDVEDREPLNKYDIAGADVLPGPIMFSSGGVERVKIISLLRKKKYEDVLQHLYESRLKLPDDKAINRSIELIENHLTMQYANRLGKGEQMLVLSTPLVELKSEEFNNEQGYLLSLLEQPCSLGELLDISALDSFNTCRNLVRFIDANIVIAEPKSEDFVTDE